jgi:hypothetical protein
MLTRFMLKNVKESSLMSDISGNPTITMTRKWFVAPIYQIFSFYSIFSLLEKILLFKKNLWKKELLSNEMINTILKIFIEWKKFVYMFEIMILKFCETRQDNAKNSTK